MSTTKETEIRITEEMAGKMIELMDSPPEPSPVALRARKYHLELLEEE